MQRIIAREIEKPIDISKLKSMVPPYCKVIKYDRLRGNTLKDIMGRYTVLIVLWNIHDKKHRVLDEPGHFFAISTRGPEKCVVFSSTGMRPSKEIMITQSDPTLLERILPPGTIYNNVSFQTSRDSNTCWRWLILYAHLAPMGLSKFQKLFAKPNLHVTNSDFLATLCTFPLLF